MSGGELIAVNRLEQSTGDVGEQAPEGPASIRDVAARAGVALSSVSRVLSGHPDVSDRMRTRVQQAADELGYEPDLLARALRRGSTMTVGFLLRDISNPLFAAIASDCERRLRDRGYSMLLANSDGEVAIEEENLGLLRRRRIDGLIASLESETADTTRRALSAYTAPIVLLDREVAGLVTAGAVLNDHFTGVSAAAHDLIAKGHRRIALVTGATTVRSTRERRRAIEAAHRRAGLPMDPSLMSHTTFNTGDSERAVARLLAQPDPPTALVAGGIGPSIGTLTALRDAGRQPGRDIAMVVLDEWPLLEITMPHLGSVARDAAATGKAAADVLIEMMAGGEPRTVVTDTRYDPRGSVIPVERCRAR